MAKTTYDSKEFKSHNKSDKPDNIVKKENDIYMECEGIQKELPSFMRSYFTYLKGNVLPMTRLAYLHDIKFFMNYLINETDLTQAKETSKITSDELNNIVSQDINLFIDYCRKYMVDDGDTVTVYENSNKSLARKQSSISVLFKQLYRDGLVSKNITDGFDIFNILVGNLNLELVLDCHEYISQIQRIRTKVFRKICFRRDRILFLVKLLS